MIPTETITKFNEAYERYRYLDGIATARAVGGLAAFNYLNPQDKQAVAPQIAGTYTADELSHANEVAKVLPEFYLEPGEDEEWVVNPAYSEARDKFGADISNAIGTVGAYTIASVSPYANILLRQVDNDNAAVKAKTYLEFGTDNGETETDFFVNKYTETDVPITEGQFAGKKTYKTDPLEVTRRDEMVVQAVVSSLHKTLFRISGADEFFGNDPILP